MGKSSCAGCFGIVMCIIIIWLIVLTITTIVGYKTDASDYFGIGSFLGCKGKDCWIMDYNLTFVYPFQLVFFVIEWSIFSKFQYPNPQKDLMDYLFESSKNELKVTQSIFEIYFQLVLFIESLFYLFVYILQLCYVCEMKSMSNSSIIKYILFFLPLSQGFRFLTLNIFKCTCKLSFIENKIFLFRCYLILFLFPVFIIGLNIFISFITSLPLMVVTIFCLIPTLPVVLGVGTGLVLFTLLVAKLLFRNTPTKFFGDSFFGLYGTIYMLPPILILLSYQNVIYMGRDIASYYHAFLSQSGFFFTSSDPYFFFSIPLQIENIFETNMFDLENYKYFGSLQAITYQFYCYMFLFNIFNHFLRFLIIGKLDDSNFSDEKKPERPVTQPRPKPISQPRPMPISEPLPIQTNQIIVTESTTTRNPDGSISWIITSKSINIS